MTEKISAVLIVRNEALTLAACLESVRPHVDELVIVDTGSTDDTPLIARKHADRFEVFTDCNDDEGRITDFSLARNYATDLASHEWVFWVDGDDVVTGGENLRRLANTPHGNENVVYLMPYNYQFAPDGTCVTQHWRERLVRKRENFRWITPVHEVYNQTKGAPYLAIPCHEVLVTHVRQRVNKANEPGRNLRILEAYHARVGEGDVRSMFYLGMELGQYGRVGESLTMLKRYVQLSGWADEKCLAMLEIGRHYLAIGDFEEAISWGLKSLTIKSWSEPHWLIGRAFYAMAQKGGPQQDYNIRRAGHWLAMGCNTLSQSVLFLSPRERGEAHVLLNACLASTGDLDGAIKSCEAGLAVIPNEENLTRNLTLYRSAKSRQAIVQELQRLTDMGAMSPDVARFMLEGLSGKLTLTYPPADVPARTPEPGKLDVVMFVGAGLEPWNPETIKKTGIGGSETMAWELSKRLAKIGHRVRLFGHAPGLEGQFDGVEFLNTTPERIKGVTCDVLICSRDPRPADPQFGIDAKARILWIHDVHSGDRLTRELDLRFDRILALSEWHAEALKAVYPFMDPAKVIVTRNGIDPLRFAQEVPARNRHKAVYSSSPDRGLPVLLSCWLRIKEKVPDAELHVFYGFQNLERVVQGNQEALGQIAQIRTAMAQLPGVHNHERVNQEELAREFLSSGTWLYPTWFTETSCITAMEAQAAGLRIVASPIAALNETVGERGKLIPGDANTPEYQAAFVDAVVEAMTKTDETDRLVNQNYATAHFGLDELAELWDGMLTSVVMALTEQPVPPFHALAYEVTPNPDGKSATVTVRAA